VKWLCLRVVTFSLKNPDVIDVKNGCLRKKLNLKSQPHSV
jgi:hypothetical protein